jgi:hypothetical protein
MPGNITGIDMVATIVLALVVISSLAVWGHRTGSKRMEKSGQLFAQDDWVRVNGEKGVWFVKSSVIERGQWIYTLGSLEHERKRTLTGSQIANA